VYYQSNKRIYAVNVQTRATEPITAANISAAYPDMALLHAFLLVDSH
jgi:hypothetical protein